MDFKTLFNQIFGYTPPTEYNFSLPEDNDSTSIPNTPVSPSEEKVNIFPSLNVNLEYMRTKYNLLLMLEENNIMLF